MAGARIGVDAAKGRTADALKQAEISSRERVDGTRIGVDIAKETRGSLAGPASPPPTRPIK